jgi:hypothetical protein
MWCLIKEKGNHTDRLGDGLLHGDSEHLRQLWRT